MARARFVPKTDALYALRSSAPVQGMVHAAAARVAASAGEGFEWSSQQGRRAPQGRWRAIVYPTTWKARRDNAANNTLVRALHGGG